MSRPWKIVMWLAIALGAGFLVIAIIGFVQRLISDSYQMLEQPFLGVGLLALAVLVVIGALTGRAFNTEGKPWWRAFLSTLPLSGFCGATVFWLVLFGFVPAINAWFDNSPPRTHRLDVTGFGSGKSRDMLYIEYEGNKRGISVPDDIIERRPKQVIVTTRDGFLGFAWVESIAVPR